LSQAKDIFDPFPFNNKESPLQTVVPGKDSIVKIGFAFTTTAILSTGPFIEQLPLIPCT
jgi:hypothetical protein